MVPMQTEIFVTKPEYERHNQDINHKLDTLDTNIEHHDQNMTQFSQDIKEQNDRFSRELKAQNERHDRELEKLSREIKVQNELSDQKFNHFFQKLDAQNERFDRKFDQMFQDLREQRKYYTQKMDKQIAYSNKLMMWSFGIVAFPIIQELLQHYFHI